MRGERPIQVLVNRLQPLIVLTLFQFIFVQTFALLTDVSYAHKLPSQPAIWRWRSLSQPISELVRMMPIKVFETNDGVAGELNRAQTVPRRCL